MKFNCHFLGTSSAVATKVRDNTSIYIETAGWNLLVDCPGGVVNKLLKMDIDYRNLDGIFITHTHPDHVYGLPSVIHSLVPTGRFPEIFIHNDSAPFITDLLRIFELEDKVEISPVTDCLKRFDIEIFRTFHSAASCGLKLTSVDKTIIYTSDTGPIGNCEKIFKDADYLIHDCFAPSRFKADFYGLDLTHTSAKTLGKIAQNSNVKNLIPIHFSGEFDFSIDEIKEELKKYYSGNIIIPEDLGMIAI